MKKVIPASVITLLMVMSGSALAAVGAGKVDYDIYGSTTLKKIDGESSLPATISPKVIKRGSFSMYNEYSGFDTSVTYQDTKGQRCTFTAGYKVSSTGPVYSSNVQKSPSNANCDLSISGEKYGKPYGFSMSMSMY